MKIVITCNAGYDLELDTITGMVTGIPEIKGKFALIGYLHLITDRDYTTEEQEEICRINTMYFAEKFMPWSQTAMYALKRFERPWKKGEKEKAMQTVMDTPVCDPESRGTTFVECFGNYYDSQEHKNNAISKLMNQDVVLA